MSAICKFLDNYLYNKNKQNPLTVDLSQKIVITAQEAVEMQENFILVIPSIQIGDD